MREGVRGVIESSLYQIMTGAILSVLGRCSVCAFVPCFSFCCTLLAERTKSNDESNSIIFPSLPSHSFSHFFPLFLAQLFPLRRIGEESPSSSAGVHHHRQLSSQLFLRKRSTRMRFGRQGSTLVVG